MDRCKHRARPRDRGAGRSRVGHGAAFDPAELAEPLLKGGTPGNVGRCGARTDEADSRQSGSLLRLYRKRPHHRRAAERQHEFTTFHRCLAPSPNRAIIVRLVSQFAASCTCARPAKGTAISPGRVARCQSVPSVRACSPARRSSWRETRTARSCRAAVQPPPAPSGDVDSRSR
jgi:hypothetical protein